MKTSRIIWVVLVVLLSVLLTVYLIARGGGGGGIPSAPTGVTATAGDGQATISWSSITGATSYNIYWSTTSGVTKTSGTKITGATSPYSHTGRTNGTRYYYIVTAVNSSGESVASSQVSATPTSASGGGGGGIPSAPTGVTATAGDGQATISWSSITGATSYNIYWSTTSGVTKTSGTKITGATSPYSHTGRTNGVTYYYIVTAVNSSGESAGSAQVSAAPTVGGDMLQLIGSYPQLYNHYGTNIFVLGNYAYFCEEHVSWTDTYVRILDVTTPSAPSLVGSYFVGGVIRAINVADGYMYLGLDNILHEVQTVNIANPAAPSLTAKDTDVSPLDIAVSGSYLYVVGDRALDPPDYIGYDFTSYSLSNKAVPLIVGRYSHPETASDYYREVAVQGNYAYIAANDNGLVVLDISNPAAPSYAGGYSSSVFNGYLEVSVSGNYACVMNMEYDIEILDISNLSSISEVGKYTPTPWALANDFVLSGQYLYVAEGTNGLKIIDISNPASPVVAGYYKPTGADPISNAVFVSGQYVYIADGQYGLMIIRFTP